MNFNFLKIKLLSFKAVKMKRDFSLSPLELWKKFIWFLILFALITFAFNGWVFYKFNFSPAGEIIPDDSALKLHSFNKAIEYIKKKEELFNDYKNNLIVEDLSQIR